MHLIEYVPGQIWIKEYPVHYAGTDFNSRMTVVRLSDSRLLLHSPCEIDRRTKDYLDHLGEVTYIVAPGSYHYFHIASAQEAFPTAETFICPGIERKQPDIEFDWFLGDRPPAVWEADLDQILVRGSKYIWEVAFFHRLSRTLILVDLIENFTDRTRGVSWQLRLWWKVVFNMWNHPKPAPEYQLGWKDKKAAKCSLERILEWNFVQVVLAHGDLIAADAQTVVREAWKTPLSHG